MPLLSDEELVQCCKSELPYETRSFEQLVNRYKDRVFGKAFSMIRNEQDAEDLAQTVFMKVFQAIPSFRGEAKFSTWLYTITVNTCLNYQDKMQRRPWWRRADDID